MFSRITWKREGNGKPLSGAGSNRPAGSNIPQQDRTGRGWRSFLFGKDDIDRLADDLWAAKARANRAASATRLGDKKTSEPAIGANRLNDPYMLRKSVSQPSLTSSRNSDQQRRQARAQNRKRDDDRGFLDRAFENAVSLAFDDEPDDDVQDDSVGQQQNTEQKEPDEFNNRSM